ncbi:MAG TPA: organic hydroperoxide resistance protein [Kofleriaceae bacterium]|nr:organic hydroperoxide resistance protein [Kofleriaceae bacterium]
MAIDLRMSTSPAILEKRLYTASATSTGGRDGRARTDDGTLDLAIAPPRSLGGTGNGTNPEQLFAAGYAACFGSAIGAVARAKKITTGPVTVTTKVTLGSIGQGYGLAVELEASLPELPRDQAEALVRAAHQVCPYSNATRGNIVVDVKLAER